MMSFRVQLCLSFSKGYGIFGNTLHKQSFHVFKCSIPENGILSVPVQPRAKLTSMEIPDAH